MPRASLTKPELQILEVLWTRGACSIREIHEALPAKGRPAFTTIQTVVYRLEKKKALRCVKRISNANIVEAVISRDDAHTTLVDELLALFGGRPKPVMARLVESGRLTLDDIKEAEDALKKLLKKGGVAMTAVAAVRADESPVAVDALCDRRLAGGAGAAQQRARGVRCWLWMAASVKFLVPLSMLVSLGERFQWRDAPAAVQPAVSFVMQDVLAPAGAGRRSAGIHPAIVARVAVAVLAVWCAGAAVVLVSWWRQWLPIRSALRRATPVRLDAQYGAADLAVMSSPSMPEPGVVGIRRPRLLLPEGIVERLTPAQLRALIAHERCHIRCHDNLAAAIHMAVEAIFWFHPAVWWIETRLVDERERACDEAVLRDRAAGRGLRRRHSRGLPAVGRTARLACVAGVSGSNLRARVEAIMRNEIGRPMTRGRRWALAVAVVAAVGGPVAGGALTAQSQVVVPPAALAFESASIKPSKPTPGIGPGARSGGESF